MNLHKFKVVNHGREVLRDMPHFALKSRTTILAPIFGTNTGSPRARALDRNDRSQRTAQTRHLGKTIDDIPR